MTFINKWFKPFFYQLYSNYGRKVAQSQSLVKTFTTDKFQTFQGLLLLFQSNSMTFSEAQELIKSGLEFKASAGILCCCQIFTGQLCQTTEKITRIL